MTGANFEEQTIRTLADAKIFARGQEHYRSGAVSGLVRRGRLLSADVHGTGFDPHEIQIDLHDGGIGHTRCSCPHEDYGYCEHIVAVLLKFAKAPDTVVERPPLADLLRGLDRDTLTRLILKRTESDRALARWLDAELAASPDAREKAAKHRPAVDPEPIREQARFLLAGRYRRHRYWDGYRTSGNSEELHRLVEKAVPFLEAGDGRNALRVLGAIAESFVDGWFEYADHDEDMYLLFEDLGRMMAEAALMSGLAPEERDDIAESVRHLQSRLDDYGVDEGFHVAVRALENGWDEPGLEAVMAGEGKTWPLSGTADILDNELTAVRLRVLDASGHHQEYLNLARAAGHHASHAEQLVKLGRIAEAVDYGLAAFKLPDDALSLAKALREAGAHTEALKVAEAGLDLDTGEKSEWHRPVSPLAHWLRDYAGGAGRTDLALRAACRAFDCTLSAEDYRATQNWAGDGWAEVRTALLEMLGRASHAYDRIRIYLSENMIDEAVQCAGGKGGYSTDNGTLMDLADAAHASHSGWVIQFASTQASRIMDENRARDYETAASWLQKAARAYKAAGQADVWATELEVLITKHKRKYKLRPLLEALRR